MPLDFNSMEEDLQIAYIKAVVARAGKTHNAPNRDRGIDITVNDTIIDSRGKHIDRGPVFVLQLKASKGFREKEGNLIVADLKIDAYNKLANWDGLLPIFLVVFDLPNDPEEWMSLDENALILRKCCYWKEPDWGKSSNKDSKAVEIPKDQVFNPSAVQDLIKKVRSKRRKGDEDTKL